MKTVQVLAVLTIVVFVAMSRGERRETFDAFREEDDAPRDFFTNRIQERREQLRNMLDPGCLVWSRRANKCFKRKRSYSARQVTLFFVINTIRGVFLSRKRNASCRTKQLIKIPAMRDTIRRRTKMGDLTPKKLRVKIFHNN